MDLPHGTLDTIIFRVFDRSLMHGSDMPQRIRQVSRDELTVEMGSLHPALYRMERQGWIESEWKITENKQRAKYYRLTRTGRKQLVSEESRWNRLVEAIGRVMRPA